MPHEDWIFCLLIAMSSLCFVIFKADIVGVFLFAGYYYIALMTFNKERYDEK